MYPDPKRVKDNRRMVRLDDYQDELLLKLSVLTGQQLATLMRDLLVLAAEQKLADMQSMQPMAA
jgi:hypothetical protein